ncbi:MAG TPA: serine protease [Puia sp.]|nr:serine protease [Puia sp.]
MKFLLHLLLFSIASFTVYSQNKMITRLESVQSVYIETYKDKVRLMSATGFIIRSKTRNYLVTNYHVVTSKNPWDLSWMDTRMPITPNRIMILQNGMELGNHIAKYENLLTSTGDTLWHRTKINNEMVDVVELPLTDTSLTTMYPVDYTLTTDSILATPTDRVFILGYPLGLKSLSDLPIWKSGYLASEPDLDQEGKPVIWVDDLPWPGMSGSPVYLISETLHFRNGQNITYPGSPKTFFMGVFSHGNAAGVYGALWKGEFLRKIFEKLP